MAVKTTALVPFPVTSIPDRLTPVYITDDTKLTTTAGSAGAVVRMNRLQSADFAWDTPVMEVTEMGAQFRPGGIDELGEVKIKLDFNAVSINNIAAICGKVVNTTPASVTTVGLVDLQSTTVDIIRLVADPTNTVFGCLYMQDVVLSEYTIDVKEKGLVTESVSGMGPNATYFPGFVTSKTYVVAAGDVTANSIVITSILGADEAPVQIFLPAAGTAPSYWQQYGAKWFLKVERLPGALLTNGPVRYYESGAPAASTVTYTAATKTLAFPASQLVAGDLIRLTFLTYNCDSLPTTIPTNSPDTTDRAGITARVVPVQINALGTTRIQSASLKFSLTRNQVQGVGETSIVYGIPDVPSITIDLDVKESDPALISLLNTGTRTLSSNGGTIANDFGELGYGTRYQLSNAVPFQILLNDPFSVGTTLVTYSCPQMVVKGINYSSSNKSDNTVKISAMDITGNLSISFTHP